MISISVSEFRGEKRERLSGFCFEVSEVSLVSRFTRFERNRNASHHSVDVPSSLKSVFLEI